PISERSPEMGFLSPLAGLKSGKVQDEELRLKPPFDIAADLDTPVSAYLKLKPFRPRFLLESVEGGERLARYSFIGFGDCLEVRLDERGLTVDGKTTPAPDNHIERVDAFRC